MASARTDRVVACACNPAIFAPVQFPSELRELDTRQNSDVRNLLENLNLARKAQEKVMKLWKC